MPRIQLLIIALVFVWTAAGWSMETRSVAPRFTIPGGPLFVLGRQERTAPIILGDILFTANLTGKVTALHRTAGYPFWTYQMPSGVDGALSYGRSRIAVGDVHGNLTLLNSRDGSVVWTFDALSQWLTPPAIYRDRVFARSSSDELIVLSERPGPDGKPTVLYRYGENTDEKMTVFGGGAPTVYADVVYQGFTNGYLVALAASERQVIWRKNLGVTERFHTIAATPVVDDQGLFVASYDGRLYHLNPKNGEIRWMFEVGAYASPLVEAERLYYSGVDGYVYALTRADGKVQWKTKLDVGIGFTPGRLGRYLVVTTSADPVYVLDGESGAVVWRGGLGTGAFSGATTVENWFYCLSNYGNLFSFEMVPGRISFPDPKAIRSVSALTRLSTER